MKKQRKMNDHMLKMTTKIIILEKHLALPKIIKYYF